MADVIWCHDFNLRYLLFKICPCDSMDVSESSASNISMQSALTVSSV